MSGVPLRRGALEALRRRSVLALALIGAYALLCLPSETVPQATALAQEDAGGLPDINIVLKRMNGRLFPFGLFKFILGFRRINLARILVLGVAKEHRRQGIDAMMTIRSFIEGHKHGYFKGDFGWILDDNEVTNNLMLGFGSRPYKRFRIYRKPL